MQPEETEKQQYVIETENNLFKGFTSKGFRNYDQMYSGKLDSGMEFHMEFLILWKIQGRYIRSTIYRHCQAFWTIFDRNQEHRNHIGMWS